MKPAQPTGSTAPSAQDSDIIDDTDEHGDFTPHAESAPPQGLYGTDRPRGVGGYRKGGRWWDEWVSPKKMGCWMPHKDPSARRMANREAQRAYRGRQRAKRVEAAAMAPLVRSSGDGAARLAAWSERTLVVPAGHPLAGEPMVLPTYGVEFVRDALTHRETLLCLGRKNAKSAIAAVLSLGLLVGPLRRPGLRVGTCSISREKAAELLRQMREIAEASNLQGLEFLKTPVPGWVRTPDGSSAEFLSADKSAGHASGFDVVIIDELGLMSERDRDLVAGMRSSTSARDGRFIAISIRGESPLLEEMLARADLDTTAVHLFAPDVEDGDDVDIHDPKIWAAGNPGLLCGIKSTEYMVDEASRVEASPSDLGTFYAFDLNLPRAPSREVIFTVGDLDAITVAAEDMPARSGSAVVGLDMGEATSATAAVAIWPSTGRVECWLAFGDVPSLIERGRRDGARYDLMHKRGELRTYPGRVTPVSDFLADVAADLAGVKVHRLAADAYKDSEIRDFLDRAGLRWAYEFRRVGAGKDGSRDVRALQRLILNARLSLTDSLALRTAVANSAIRRDANGNAALDKATSRGRIDALSALVVAAGLAEPMMDRPPRRRPRSSLTWQGT